jgi:hypothetical protein
MSACVISLDPREFIAWARGIARGVRADYRFAAGGQEELELEGTALEQLVALAARFDESRLRPGDDAAALYRTAARARLTVVPLPVSRCDDGTEVMLAAREPEDDPDPDERGPVACDYEPQVTIWRSRA